MVHFSNEYLGWTYAIFALFMATNYQLAYYSADCSTVYEKMTNLDHTVMDGLNEKADYM